MVVRHTYCTTYSSMFNVVVAPAAVEKITLFPNPGVQQQQPQQPRRRRHVPSKITVVGRGRSAGGGGSLFSPCSFVVILSQYIILICEGSMSLYLRHPVRCAALGAIDAVDAPRPVPVGGAPVPEALGRAPDSNRAVV